MRLVSVLCIPVSSIPTSLSFFKSFCPCNCFAIHAGKARSAHSSHSGKIQPPASSYMASRCGSGIEDLSMIYEYVYIVDMS